MLATFYINDMRRKQRKKSSLKEGFFAIVFPVENNLAYYWTHRKKANFISDYVSQKVSTYIKYKS